MTINYIVKGFDKNFYNFDAVVVPVMEKHDNSGQDLLGYRLQFLSDFRNDFIKIMQELPISAFKSDGVTAVKSEKTGIYYIFVLIKYIESMPYGIMNRRTREIYRNKNYIYCCNKMIKYINKLDVKNIFVHPAFNQAEFNMNKDSDFLANTLKSSIDRFSQKNIYILVEELSMRRKELSMAFRNMENGVITPEECKQTYIKVQMEQSLSYTNSLIRTAEIETKYKPKTIAEQFFEDMNNDSWFFYEYINRYQGTATELAKKADIDKSNITKIKRHECRDKSKKLVLSLAIALDLTVEDRKRFINSAGFSYPITEQDQFIEQQLRKKRYNDVLEFNEDICEEHPNWLLGRRSSK